MTITFPKSCVIYLRSNKNTKDTLETTIVTPGGSVTYDVKILKVKNYTIDEILEKKLYFLIPFYCFKYEKELKRYKEYKKIFLQDYIKIRDALNQLVKDGEMDEYTKQSIFEMTKVVLKQLTRSNKDVMEGVKDIMGGKILDYEAKDILNQGKDDGIKIGTKEEKKNGLNALVKSLKEFILDEDTLYEKVKNTGNYPDATKEEIHRILNE